MSTLRDEALAAVRETEAKWLLTAEDNAVCQGKVADAVLAMVARRVKAGIEEHMLGPTGRGHVCCLEEFLSELEVRP